MKRGFFGSSKKKPADSRRICKSTREVSIDTLQAIAIDILNQAPNNTVHHVSGDTIHHRTVYHGTVHLSIVLLSTVHRGTVHPPSNNIVHPQFKDTVHPPSNNPLHPAWIRIVHLLSIAIFNHDTLHCDIVYRDTFYDVIVHSNTVHPDIVHQVKNDTNFGETEMVEVLIPSVAKREELKPIYIKLMRQRPFHGFPHEQAMDHINMFEELVLFIFNGGF